MKTPLELDLVSAATLLRASSTWSRRRAAAGAIDEARSVSL